MQSSSWPRWPLPVRDYRVAFGPGHHQTTFEAAELALGAGSTSLTTYFDTCRRKRNVLDYDLAHVVTDSEADELLQTARDFAQLVEAWIAQHHPQFVP